MEGAPPPTANLAPGLLPEGYEGHLLQSPKLKSYTRFSLQRPSRFPHSARYCSPTEPSPHTLFGDAGDPSLHPPYPSPPPPPAQNIAPPRRFETPLSRQAPPSPESSPGPAAVARSSDSSLRKGAPRNQSVHSQDSIYASSPRNVPAATSSDAASCATKRCFRRCANCSGGEVSWAKGSSAPLPSPDLLPSTGPDPLTI